MSSRCFLGFSACLIPLVWMIAAPRAGANPPKEPFNPPPGPIPGLRQANGLTPEECERVRQVFSRVWNEPDVVAAREAVHQATVRYRGTLKEAVERADPSVSPLLDKMHRNIKSSAGKHRTGPGAGGKRSGSGGSPPPLPQDPVHALDRLVEHEPGMEALDPAGRKRFFDLAREAAKDKVLQELLAAAIATVEPASEAVQARRRFKERLFQAMAKRDPWVEQVLKRPAPKERPRADGNPRGAEASPGSSPGTK